MAGKSTDKPLCSMCDPPRRHGRGEPHKFAPKAEAPEGSGLKTVATFEVEPHEIGGIKYGSHVVVQEFPKVAPRLAMGGVEIVPDTPEQITGKVNHKGEALSAEDLKVKVAALEAEKEAKRLANAERVRRHRAKKKGGEE